MVPFFEGYRYIYIYTYKYAHMYVQCIHFPNTMTLFPHMLQSNVNSLERPILHLPARSKQASCVLLPRSYRHRFELTCVGASPFQRAVVSLGKIATSSAFFSRVRLVKSLTPDLLGNRKELEVSNREFSLII